MRRRRGGPNHDEADPSWARIDDGRDSGALLAKPARSPLLIAFVACVFFALGFDAGVPVALAVGCALEFVAAVGLLGGSSAFVRALGSSLFGTVALLASVIVLVQLWPGAVELGIETGSSVTSASLLGAAVGVGGVGVAVLVGRGGCTALRTVVRESAVAALVVTPTLVLVLDGRIFDVLVAIGRGIVVASTRTPALALLTLQFLGVCAVVLVVAVRPELEMLVPRVRRAPTAGDATDRVRAWPELWRWLLVGYVAVWFVPGVLRTINSALASLGAVGFAIETLLTSGVLHGTLVGLLGVLLSVGAGVALSQPVRRWFEPTPIRTLTAAAGGIVVPVVIVAGGTVAGSEAPLPTLAVTPFVAAYPLVRVVDAAATQLEFPRSTLVGIGATSVFGTTLLLATAGLSPIGILGGVAAAIVVWDIGTNTLSVHRTVVDPGVDATAPIATHATTTLAVAALGVLLSGAALVATTVGGDYVSFRWAEAAIVFLLATVLSFAVMALRLPSTNLTIVRPIGRGIERTASRPMVLGALALVLSLVLGWAVDSRFYILTIGLTIVFSMALVGPDNREKWHGY